MPATAALALLAWRGAPAPPASGPEPAPGDWPVYGHDAGGSRYSPLADVNGGNVSRLETAWTFHTGALTPASDLNRKAAFEATPILVDGTLFVSTPFSQVFALDPVTGAPRWSFDPKVDRARGYSEVTSRGVAAWRDGTGSTAACSSRIFLGTIDARLVALDGRTGTPCAGFGRGGEVDLGQDVDLKDFGDYQLTSPPTVVGDLVIVGSSIGDNRRYDVESGAVRAFDTRSGKLRWRWEPLRAGLGKTGAGNAWSAITADVARDLVFVPTGSPSPDYYGGLRPGDDRDANSVVALRASTGERVWGFQVVHHDLWDYDVAAPPMLVSVTRDGREVPAVAVNTKMGHFFLLDRETGRPLFPVEERPVPASDIPGEAASATQPFPITPALTAQRLRPEDAWGLRPEDRETCRRLLSTLRNEGMFTPPGVRGTVVFPGSVGGVNWGGAAWDPSRRLMIVAADQLAWMVRLIPRESYESERRSGADNRLTGEFARQEGTPYGMYRESLRAGAVPCTPPPWGTLVAVDLQKGQKRWTVPLGRLRRDAGFRGVPFPIDVEGTIVMGSPLVTAGGLVFISATWFDDRLHVYDVETGRLVREIDLPAGGQASPMTYRGRDGRQYVVICAGGHGKAGTTPGDAVVAFALAR